MNQTAVNTVAWSDAYALNLPEIDAQHKTLFDILNELWLALVHKPEASEALKLIESLEQYTISHFTAEELFMRVVNYPKFEAHRAMHAAFIARIAEERVGIESGKKQVSLGLLHFLNDWLVDHILVADREYAGHFAQEQKPQSFLGGFFSRFSRQPQMARS